MRRPSIKRTFVGSLVAMTGSTVYNAAAIVLHPSYFTRPPALIKATLTVQIVSAFTLMCLGPFMSRHLTRRR